MQQGQGPASQHAGWSGNGWSGLDHQNPAMSSTYPPHAQGYSTEYGANASSVDELVSGAAREPDDIDEIIRMAEAGIKPPKKGDIQSTSVSAPTLPSAPAPVTAPVQAPAPAPEITVPESNEKPETAEKKAKKEKDKNTKMVYSDNEVSPEEKMAKMPRYAFVPGGKDETALVDATQAPPIASVADE